MAFLVKSCGGLAVRGSGAYNVALFHFVGTVMFVKVVGALAHPLVLAVFAAAAVAVLAAAALSGPGFAREWWGLGTAFSMLRYTAWAALVLVPVMLVLAGGNASCGRVVAAAAALVLALVCGWYSWSIWDWREQARSVPPIHDISTNLDEMPQFRVLAPDNPNRDNWLEQHRLGYADLQTVEVPLSVANVIALAERYARRRGWEVALADPEGGRLEATETSRWYGFKDDLVVRARPLAAGRSSVDLRSVSRFGGSDLGMNAERIRGLLAAMPADESP